MREKYWSSIGCRLLVELRHKINSRQLKLPCIYAIRIGLVDFRFVHVLWFPMLLMWWHWVMAWMFFVPFWTSCEMCCECIFFKNVSGRCIRANAKNRKPIEAIRVMRAKRSITLVVFDDNAARMHHKYYYKTQSNLTPCSYFIWCTFEAIEYIVHGIYI